MTDPIAPDALREAVIAIVASFYGSQTAIELTDAVLAEVAKHRDAEVERMRCGGCQGLGTHRQWCRAVVDPLAAHIGPRADALESLGDVIGSNEPGLANKAYALAGEVRAWLRSRSTGADQ